MGTHKAEARATIARVDKKLDRAPAPPEPVVIETRSARWRREAAESETARQVERERERVDDWLRRSATRDQQQQDHAHQVARDQTLMFAHEVAAVLDTMRDQLADLTERIDKLDANVSDLKAERSFDRALHKAHGEIVTLPSRRVS